MEDMKNSNQALNWFEIPVSNIQRARKFYEAIFDITFQDVDTGDGNKYAFSQWTGQRELAAHFRKDHITNPLKMVLFYFLMEAVIVPKYYPV